LERPKKGYGPFLHSAPRARLATGQIIETTEYSIWAYEASVRKGAVPLFPLERPKKGYGPFSGLDVLHPKKFGQRSPDGTGQYRIVDLLPGTYTVRFTLTGFATVKRERIELSGSLTAAINADLKVGTVQETITVTGETPIVDVQSVRARRR